MWKKTRICTIHRHSSERFFIPPIASKETETTKHGKKLLQWKLTEFQVKESPNSVSNRFKSQTFWPKISFLESSLILSGKLLFSFASWNSDNNAKHVTKNNPTSCLLVERHRLSVSGTQIKQWEQLFFPVYMAVACSNKLKVTKRCFVSQAVYYWLKLNMFLASQLTKERL